MVVPLALIFFAPRRRRSFIPRRSRRPAAAPARVLGLPPNVVFVMMCAAVYLCCIPMAMPQQHLVAYLQRSRHYRARSARSCCRCCSARAFFSRQVWGAISDRIGGLATVLIGSIWQCAAMIGFLLTQNEAGLFMVAGAFGLGFSGMIPAYVLAMRELYPAAQASWRIPTRAAVHRPSAWPPAAGSPAISTIIFGYYAPAFAVGIGANLLNIVIIGIAGRAAALAPRLCCLSGPIARTPTRMKMSEGRRHEREPGLPPRPAPRSPPRQSTRTLRRRSRSATRSGGGGTGCARLHAEPDLDQRGRAPPTPARPAPRPARHRRESKRQRRRSSARTSSAIMPITASILARQHARRRTGAVATRSGASSPEIDEPGEPAGELPGRHHQHRDQARHKPSLPSRNVTQSSSAGGSR